MDDIATRLTDVMAERLIEEKRAIANSLRRIADAVDQAEPRTNIKTLTPRYGPVAKDVMHSIMWGVANLNLDHFVGEAAELDALLASEEATDGAA